MVNNKISLAISGIEPFSTIDYPEHLSAVIFCQGCPFKCHYCHNPDFIIRNGYSKYKWQEVQALLIKRKNFLEAVVFSGGEPTLQKDLYDAISRVKALGYKIGLHTAGPFPTIIEKIIPLLNWIGLDIKAPFAEYEKITSIPNSGNNILASIKLILANNIPCEFRTTIHPKLLTNQQILEIAETLKFLGANNYTLQKFRALGCKNKGLCEHDLIDFPDQNLLSLLAKQFASFKIV